MNIYKKIFFGMLIFTCLFVLSCKNVENGYFNISNKSTHTIKFEFAQNYQSSFYSLAPNEQIRLKWTGYHLCIISNPALSVIKINESKSNMNITDIQPKYKYTVRNNISGLKFYDAKKSIYSALNKPTDALTIPTGEQEINCYQLIDISNLILKSDENINISGKTYPKIEKMGNDFYINKNISGKLITNKIEIKIQKNLIIIASP
ncbi:MAG: hypothetical protein CR988_02270 [Treponema sp.]|nr:MAG: hypothetical protein CR988_02270 [Treponema sp.]